MKDAGALCRLFDLPFITVFNAGVIYFEKTAASKAVFDKTRAIYDEAN